MLLTALLQKVRSGKYFKCR